MIAERAAIRNSEDAEILNIAADFEMPTFHLGFVRQEVSQCYERSGNVSVDPVIVRKRTLFIFSDSVKTSGS